MKTSLLIAVLILINTSALVSAPLTKLLESISIWWLIGIELCLIIAYYINRIIKDLRSLFEIEFNNLKF